MNGFKQRTGAIAYRLLVWFARTCVLVFFLWAIGALYYWTSVPYALRVVLALTYLFGVVQLFRRTPQRGHWFAYVAGSVIAVYMLTLTQRPSNERDWVAEQARMPIVTISDNNVSIKNYRDNVYRSETDFDVHYRDVSFQLSEIKAVWFVVQKFSPLEGLAHTFLSFELDRPSDPRYFSVSVEVRREKGEVYSPIRGLYRQFEVIYVIGDERDIIGQRTVMRPADRVWMYRVNATPEETQRLFVDIARQTEKLQNSPEFYHTMLRNCTNEIVTHTYELTPEPINWMDPRIVLPGFSGRFAHSQALVGEPGQTFSQLQQQAQIDAIARDVGLTNEFSDAIREPQR